MRIEAVSISGRKGTPKTPVNEAVLVAGMGLDTDAHAGPWHRQVSLLASERIAEVREKGLDVSFGDFAENIATSGIDWTEVPIGSRVQVGDMVVLEITQIGKVCHTRCAIYHKVGDCVMPREGVFARVVKGGKVRPGDNIQILGA